MLKGGAARAGLTAGSAPPPLPQGFRPLRKNALL